MIFLYPKFLWALSLLSIPIIIHLFHFRRFKTIYFSHIGFIQSLKNEKQTKTKLKHYLILACRLLAIGFLVFAFAQPYFPNRVQHSGIGKRSISIYVDNSSSMENIGKQDKLFEQARKTAIEIVKSYQINDEFQVLSNDLKLKEEKYTNQERAISILEELQISTHSRKLNTINNKIKSTSNNISSHDVYLISDFQKSTASLDKIDYDSLSNYYLVQEEPINTHNISIDSAWFSSPILNMNQDASLQVRISNKSDQDLEKSSLRLNLNGIQKLSSFSLGANTTEVFIIDFKLNRAGWNTGIISIDDYPITFDDIYYLSFFIKNKSNILLIKNENNPFISSVFKTDPYFDMDEIFPSSFNQQKMMDKDLIIISGLLEIPSIIRSEIIEYVMDGGNLLIIPPSKSEFKTETYTQLFNDLLISPFEKQVKIKQKVNQLNYEHPLLKNILENIEAQVDLPVVYQYYSRSKNRYYAEVSLLTLENGDPFFSISQAGKGNVFVISAPADPGWSNFYTQWLFLPMMYNSALYHNTPASISYQVGKDRSFFIPELRLKTKTLKFRQDEREFIPSFKMIDGRVYFYLTDEFLNAGFYQLQSSESSGPDLIEVAINANRRESNTDIYSREELQLFTEKNHIEYLNTSSDKVSSRIDEINHGKAFWKLLILFVLFFLLCEILIIRLFR